MDKVQKPDNYESYTPSSEPFRIYLNQDLLTPAYNSVAYRTLFLLPNMDRYEARLVPLREGTFCSLMNEISRWADVTGHSNFNR
jgi:hypothetical protein